MKKANKKGFTLAELLIVVAIIAVLIAIAIPTFAGALDNAKRQTDHANIRSAYAVVQIGKLNGTLGQGLSGDKPTASAAITVWTMQKDGTFVQSGSNAYELKIGGESTSCSECNGCTLATHVKGRKIFIVYRATGGWTLEFGTTAPTV